MNYRGLYDMVAYIVSAMVTENDSCLLHNPVFDIVGGQNGLGDGKVDSTDLAFFLNCATGPGVVVDLEGKCKCLDIDGNSSIDMNDFAVFQRCYTGDAGPLNPACDDAP